MSRVATASPYAIQLFDSPPDAVFTIEFTAHLVDMPRRSILVYCKHRLLSPVLGGGGGYYFDHEGIRALRRIKELRAVCGNDLAGIKIILDLTEKLERLRSELGSLVPDPSQPKKVKPQQGRKQNEWN
jgi:MerR family transcriptional regulator/heat shock protein HspR